MTGSDSVASGALVVVAHPDDEVFWFTPILRDSSRIVAALPVHGDDESITRGRLAVRDAYPVEGFEFLPIRSAGVYRKSDWLRRRPITEGVTLMPSCPTDRAGTYVGNYASILEELEPYVVSSPVVFTHNPWGEYGHEEHIQVSQAVVELAKRQGSSVWAWEGFSASFLMTGRMRLRHDYYRGKTDNLPRLALRNDLLLFRQLRDLYRSHGAWTGDAQYEPTETSNFIQLVREGEVLIERAPPPRALKLRIVARTVVLDGARKLRKRLPRRFRPRGFSW